MSPQSDLVQINFEAKVVRVRDGVEVAEWTRYCTEFPGCRKAHPELPCCGDGYWKSLVDQEQDEG